ncbi:MAG TPA: hypothetical protein VHE12_10025, partial [bacterium]|nr:hypothetical protein [bacterium]
MAKGLFLLPGRSIGSFLFLFLLFTRLHAAAINYTSTSYCPSETSFTVTEQTTAYNQQTSNSVSLGNCGVNMNMYD